MGLLALAQTSTRQYELNLAANLVFCLTKLVTI